MIGTEDRILNTWAHFVKNYSFLPLIGDGSTKYVFIIFFLLFFFWEAVCLHNLLTEVSMKSNTTFENKKLQFLFPYQNFMWISFWYNWLCRIQPVYVVDAASAIIAALKDDGTSMGKVYELGGPDVFSVHQLVIFFFCLFVLTKLLQSVGVDFYWFQGWCRQRLCLTRSANGLTMWKFLSLLLR